MHNKFCRIVWNTAGWRKPTGNSGETGKSYAAKHGFGHEEWLFNYEWLIKGFRYGFLQPIGKYRETYAGHSCSIILYTYTPDKETLLIGRINNVYIPKIKKLENVLEISRERGWIEQMRKDVYHISGNTEGLGDPKPDPDVIANVRFRPEDVEIFDPMPRIIDKNHKIVRVKYYQPFDWTDDNYPETDNQSPHHEPSHHDPRRPENERTRAAQEAGIVDPKHVRLQNILYKYLCKKHGESRVDYERRTVSGYVDLAVQNEEGYIFYEIKMETTAKRCIRLALGQLVEYANYPGNTDAIRLVVVGDAPLKSADRSYLCLLRSKFRLPIYYSQFLWESNKLKSENQEE